MSRDHSLRLDDETSAVLDTRKYQKMKMASTLYIHGTIVTINKNRDIILDGALHIVDSRIIAVGKTETLASSQDLPRETRIVDLKQRIVIPGLINTHAHTAQSLLRGLAENMPLQSWLCDSIWPLEANYSSEDGYVAASLTIAEMLKSGTTCFLESMLTFRAGFDNVAKAVEESGIRACLVSHISLPSGSYAHTVREN